jgi:hypothetical protein
MAAQTYTPPTSQLHGVLESFFETKTACDVERLAARCKRDCRRPGTGKSAKPAWHSRKAVIARCSAYFLE